MPTLAVSPVSETRLAIAVAITSLPVFRTPPDDVAHIPCVVVGRARWEFTQGMGGLVDFEFPVVVVGRAYDTEESDLELDDATWAVIRNLDAAGASIPAVRSADVEPGLATIGGHEQPVNTITLHAAHHYCL